MKDKRAKQLKAKRAAQRIEEKKKRMAAAEAEFKAMCEKNGIKPKASAKTIWKAHQAVRQELFEQTVVYCNIAVFHALNTLYGYGRDRLFRLAGEIHDLLISMNGSRTVIDFADEIRHDTELDIIPYMQNKLACKEYNEFYKQKCRTVTAEARAERVGAIRQDAAGAILLAVYPLYWGYGFRGKRLTAVLDKSAEALNDILTNDSFGKYREYFIKKGLRIELDGHCERKGLNCGCS